MPRYTWEGNYDAILPNREYSNWCSKQVLLNICRATATLEIDGKENTQTTSCNGFTSRDKAG